MNNQLKSLLEGLVESLGADLNIGSDMMPMWYVGNHGQGEEKGAMHIFATPFDGPAPDFGKNRVVGLIRRHVAELNADFVVFISEAWSLPSEYAKEFAENRDKYPQGLATHPKRFDVVNIVVETPSERYWAGCPIKKSGDGRRYIDAPQYVDGKGVKGRFSNFYAAGH